MQIDQEISIRVRIRSITSFGEFCRDIFFTQDEYATLDKNFISDKAQQMVNAFIASQYDPDKTLTKEQIQDANEALDNMKTTTTDRLTAIATSADIVSPTP